MERPFNKILIPIDGSRYAMQAADYGIAIAKAYGTRIISLYVIDETALASLGKIEKNRSDGLRQRLQREGENCLHDLQGRAEGAGVEFEGRIKEGTPHRVIVALAKEEGVDLILIGKVGQRGPRRIMIGSVTEQVIESAPCPVLVVRPS